MNGSQSITLPSAFDALNVGITVHDPETGEILGVNRRLEQLYGYTAEELNQMTVEDYTAPSTKFTQEEAVERIRAAADGDPQQFDWQVKRANGEIRWVQVHLDATRINGVDCVVAEIRDITEQRARERRLRLLSRIVRHNLRNQMNVVAGRAETLQQTIADDDLADQVSKILDVAREAGNMAESVRQIEQIAAPNATERSATNIARLVRSLVEEAKSEYPSADLSFTADTDVSAVADDGVKYAVEQAIENAVEHNDADRPSVTVTVTEDSATEQAIIRIVDDGPPIPSVETDILDETVETSSTYHGTGVGLWVVQWCVDSLGGTLSFEENTPRGNVVSIALPKRESELSEAVPTGVEESALLD